MNFLKRVYCLRTLCPKSFLATSVCRKQKKPSSKKVLFLNHPEEHTSICKHSYQFLNKLVTYLIRQNVISYRSQSQNIFIHYTSRKNNYRMASTIFFLYNNFKMLHNLQAFVITTGQ